MFDSSSVGVYTSILLFSYFIFKFQAVKRRSTLQSATTTSSTRPKTSLYETKDNPDTVVPVSEDFDWQTASPLKSYPFKNAEYKLTMGIKNLDIQDWLLIESSYLSKIEEKTKIATNNHPLYPKSKDLTTRTIFITDECVPAIREFYDLVVGYLCDKYPMYFVKHENEGTFLNKITNETHPLSSEKVSVSNTKDLLFKLVRNIEEDFIILLKDPTREDEVDGKEYFFKGGVFAFAAGFNPHDRFDKPLSFVHHPIPGYESKLKLSMNRFFDRISPGKFVTRSNFSVQLHPLHYVDDQNKGHNTPEMEEVVPLKMEDLDFDTEVHYRSERQVLTKLPKSGAVVFTIRTYLLPMSQLKSEGQEVCDRFVGAIKGLPQDISEYKRAVEWGPALVEYLQS